MVQLEAEKADLERVVAGAKELPPLLHPEMASFYREQVAALHGALQDKSEQSRMRAFDAIRSLIDKIVVTPIDGAIAIDVYGDIVGILDIAANGSSPDQSADGFKTQVKYIAGACNHRDLPPLIVAI